MSAQPDQQRSPDADRLAQVTADDFKQIFRRHPAGVAVVTLINAAGTPVGFTATSVISVAATPPTVAFSLAASSRSWPAVARSESLVINFLTAEQAEASSRFAATDVDRFAAGGWSVLDSGEPVLDGGHSWLRGTVNRRIPVGPSFLIIVDVLRTEVRSTEPPLVYHDRAHHTLVPAVPREIGLRENGPRENGEHR